MENMHARELYSFYGKSPVIQGVSFDLEPGEFLAVLGRNGVGKTTLLKSIMGLTDRCDSGLAFGDRDILGLSTPQRSRLGTCILQRTSRSLC
ncbi:MAG: ATP-binding cassette domain-containing protein [Paracoccus sp. (in: a-proteobacteria)]